MRLRLALPRPRLPHLRLPRFSLSLTGGVLRLRDWVMGAGEADSTGVILYDRTLLWLTFGLAAMGFIMVTSASMPIGQRLADDPFRLPSAMRFTWRWLLASPW